MNAGLLAAHWRFEIARHGWPLPLALVMMAVAAGVALLATPPVRTQVRTLDAALASAHADRSRSSDPQETQRRQLTAFYAGLPTAAGALEAIAMIQRAADANGVTLAQGEYRLSRDAGAQLMRYQITLPARSDYPRLRAWLSDVMNAVPSASLDELSLRRDDAARDAVDARVRLTLFMRAS